jgi:hypothetical protein
MPGEGRLGHMYTYNPGQLTEAICEVVFRYYMLTFGLRSTAGETRVVGTGRQLSVQVSTAVLNDNIS